MKTFKDDFDIPKDFTGICKMLDYNSIRYYKNGKIHREDGPAIICDDGINFWFLNGLCHRESAPAKNYNECSKYWCYKNKCYGENSEFTNTSWLDFIKQLKYEEMLKIFR